MIDDLIAQVAGRTGMDPNQARQALAGAMALINRHGDQAGVTDLHAAIPGSAALAEEGAGMLPQGGGMLGGLLKSMGGGPAADALAMASHLASKGISPEDLKSMLPVAMEWVQSKTGQDLLRNVLKGMPGVGGLLGAH